MSKPHGIGLCSHVAHLRYFIFDLVHIILDILSQSKVYLSYLHKNFLFSVFFSKFSPQIFSGGHLYLPAGGNIIQYYDSRYSSLLTDISYAILFSLSSSLSFFMYSRLWILPQICVWPPTSNPDAKRAFLPQQIHGI